MTQKEKSVSERTNDWIESIATRANTHRVVVQFWLNFFVLVGWLLLFLVLTGSRAVAICVIVVAGTPVAVGLAVLFFEVGATLWQRYLDWVDPELKLSPGTRARLAQAEVSTVKLSAEVKAGLGEPKAPTSSNEEVRNESGPPTDQKWR